MWMLLCIITAVILWLTTKQRYRWFYVALKTLPRDIKITAVYFKIYNIARIAYRDKLSVDKAFDVVAEKNSEKVAFYFEKEKWTFAQVQELSYKFTRYFMNEGYVKGDTIALLMENCPEYPCVFLGLSRIGVITALINTNLQKDPLLHSITVVKPKGLIILGSCKKSIEEISARLENIKLYQFNRIQDKSERLPNSTNLEEELHKTSGIPLKHLHHKADPKDPIIYIYTSGTTGLPKASVLTQLRYLLGAKTFALISDISHDDVLYTTLPLYHTAGGLFGLGQALITGIPVVIRKKFSASNFFSDCERYHVTVAQYIGEMCRYILASDAQLKAENHQIRVMVGNGLKPQIWKTFAAKFNIKKIVEVYGATEGVSNFVNIDNKVGAVGYIPWFLRPIFTITLLKCDESGQLIKNSEGRYVQCSVDEPGVAVGKIDLSKAVLHFDGYTDKKATEKKILRNVFRKGDMYFNSGDILKYDEFGYVYFVDRTGDTFRWKGENVSTAEIEAVISNLVQLADVVVYGVEIPFTEGRAGMAAIMDPNNTLDIGLLGLALKSSLPSYAIPMFIRILDAIPLTGTFKLKKVELRDEGYNFDKVQDRIYIFDSKADKYVSLNKSLYECIKNGTLRL